MSPNDEFWTLEEVCERYRLQRTALLDMVEEGKFPPALRLSPKRFRFRVSEVIAWEELRWQGQGDRAARAEAAKASIRQPRSLRA